MKKTKKNEPATKPTPTQTAPVSTQAPVQETDEARQTRVDRANKAIREILVKENCILMVPTLDISSGRVFAKIQLVAQALK